MALDGVRELRLKKSREISDCTSRELENTVLELTVYHFLSAFNGLARGLDCPIFRLLINTEIIVKIKPHSA